MGYTLQSEYVFDSLSSTGLDKVPLYGRIRVGQMTGVMVSNVTSSSTTIEQAINSGNIIPKEYALKSTSCSSSKMYLLVPGSGVSSIQGELNVMIKDGSGNTTCSFIISLLGTGVDDFKITRCSYSNSIKTSSAVSTTYGSIAYPGFCLLRNRNGIYLTVLSTSKCASINCYYENCRFVPPLTQTSQISPDRDTNQIFAIREGGGTFIQDLGCIKHNYRNNSSSSNDTYDFYLFSNGFYRWTSGVSLSSSYYHQWSRGNFANTNVSVSTYNILRGSTSPGSTYSQQLPNITGKTIFWGTTNQASNFSSSLSGSFSVGSRGKSDGMVVAGTIGTGYWIDSNFDASRSSSIYQSGGDVRPYSLTVTYVLQAF